jgi:psiF repeat
MKSIKIALVAASLALAGAGAALAQDANKATTKELKAPKVRSEVSIACSKDADAKGLHGKARKTFRKECMKGKH